MVLPFYACLLLPTDPSEAMPQLVNIIYFDLYYEYHNLAMADTPAFGHDSCVVGLEVTQRIRRWARPLRKD